MKQENIVIIGAGPCGLATAISLRKIGIDPLIIEKENIVHTIYRYPTHQTFFSTPNLLEIGHIPFIIEERKPRRNQALTYYREVVRHYNLRIQTYEQVEQVDTGTHPFQLKSKTNNGHIRHYECAYVIIATGYYDHPNLLNIPGEHLDKVHHYFKEAHPYFNQDVAIIGGRNSAIDAALELDKVGARVTILYRGNDYSTSIKPWILPEFVSLVRKQKVNMLFETEVLEIKTNEILYRSTLNKKEALNEEARNEESLTRSLPNNFVLAMTGYHPDHPFLRKMGIHVDEQSGRLAYDPETMETNISNVYIAGVMAAGNNANEIFIENGRFHGEKIAASIAHKEKSHS